MAQTPGSKLVAGSLCKRLYAIGQAARKAHSIGLGSLDGADYRRQLFLVICGIEVVVEPRAAGRGRCRRPQEVQQLAIDSFCRVIGVDAHVGHTRAFEYLFHSGTPGHQRQDRPGVQIGKGTTFRCQFWVSVGLASRGRI